MSAASEETSPSGATRPARRRERATGSARSLLLTLLGEFALPRRQPVWTATVVDALGALGVEEKAARQALARTSTEGLLVPERLGRRTRWSLTDAGTHLLEEGTDRIYGFLRHRQDWDGQWLVLAVTVPETHRQLRHRLRTRLTWAGLGSPAPGLWVVPDAKRVDDVAEIVSDLGIEESAFSWVGPYAGIGDEDAVISAAWSLDSVSAAYGEFITAFGRRSARRQEQAFVAQVELVQSWRRFPFLDPALPAQLLPTDWPGIHASEVFHRQHGRWHDGAQAYWDVLCEDAEGRA
ncbi:MAG TPA: PaaX family transcriptional regulator C-terminal domain-containing protein [Actinomycetales bacterium]|nr:PaaX family transcriptional regulator C-terminal domain-containing protein [Actinomycetales bacterium]